MTPVEADGIRKAIGRLGGLMDWTDFQPKGTKAPCGVRLWAEDGQEWCQLIPQKLPD